MTPLVEAIVLAAPQITFAKNEDEASDHVAPIILQLAEAAQGITSCFNGAEQFKDPNQLELPLE